MNQQQKLTIEEQITNINRFLRKTYYGKAVKIKRPYELPPDLYSGEVLGPWPVYIIHSFPCKYFGKGFCTPCFFSLIPSIDADKSVIYQSLLNQCDVILDRFNELVLSKQTREIPFPQFPSFLNDKPGAIFGFTTTGTFFGRNEAPPEIVIKLIEKIALYAKRMRVNICINIETRAEDVLDRYGDGTLNKLANYLDDITIMNSIGLESVNEVTRNLIYGKNLNIDDFDQAVKITKQFGMIPNAFVHTGFFSMTQKELLSDFDDTVTYLYKQNLSPIVTFPNLCPYTLSHLLYSQGKLKLFDPRIAVQMIEKLVALNQSFRSQNYHGDPWYIGLGDQEPNPFMNIFDNPQKTTCARCTKIIYDAIRSIRRNYSYDLFSQLIKPIYSCSCKDNFENEIESEELCKTSLHDRINASLELAWEKRRDYLGLRQVIEFTENRCQ
ncbi:MAG: hypothetical protein WCK35_04830 [Chloroflexota bacterium]